MFRLTGTRKKHLWEIVLFLLLTGGLLTSVVFAIGIGSADVPPSEVFGILIDRIFRGGNGIAQGDFSAAHVQIVWNIRLPRVLFGMLCGIGLSVCGAAMQSLVLNPIADPYLLGISSGASAGAALALLTPLPLFAGQYQAAVLAFFGALIAAGTVYFMAKIAGRGTLQPVSLLLSGTAVNAVMSAITSFLIFLAKSPESLAAVYNWQMGSLASAQWGNLLLPAVGSLTGLILFTLMGSRFNLLVMGEEDATALGLPVRRFRTGMFFLCSAVVATLVSVTGIIGFVGLVVPHIVRLLAKTSDNRRIIPLSGLLGSIYLIWADALARNAFGAVELPLGIVTAFAGAPCFLFLMVRRGNARGKS